MPPFLLTLDADAAPVAGEARTIEGRLSASDWLVGERQTYTLQVDAPGLYTVSLESDAFDTRLELSGNGVTLEDDDGGNGTDSRLVAPLPRPAIFWPPIS